MMRDDFGLGGRASRIVAQDFRGMPVQRLSTAPEQAVVSCVLDQRMPEAIGRLSAGPFDEQEVRVDKAIERGLQAAVVDRGYRSAVCDGFVDPTYRGARARSRA